MVGSVAGRQTTSTVDDKQMYEILDKAKAAEASPRSSFGDQFARQKALDKVGFNNFFQSFGTGDPNFEKAFKFTSAWEGGYSNHPNDSGGATNFGITQATFEASGGSGPVANITKEQAKEIYRKYFWEGIGANKVQDPLATVLFDTAVNFGTEGAKKFISEIGGLGGDPSITAQKLVEARKNYRHQRVAEKSNQQTFLQGWLNRDNALMAYVKSNGNSGNS